MAPIFELFDYILSKYFENSINYDYIKKLKLPLWFFALVGVLVLLISLWIILIAHGVKHIIYRCFVCRPRKSTNNLGSTVGAKQFGRSFPITSSINSRFADTDESSDTSPLYIHIRPRKEIHWLKHISFKITCHFVNQKKKMFKFFFLVNKTESIVRVNSFVHYFNWAWGQLMQLCKLINISMIY